MHQVPLGFTMVHVCVPMLKLLVSLGIVFPSADDLSPKGLQQQVTQREQGVLAFRAESRRLVHSPFPQSFFHSSLIVQQRPVQDSVEAEEDLDLKQETPKRRRAGM